jgi:tetratricopeptide (TPR) repeat protein
MALSSEAKATEPNRYRTDSDDLAWIRREHPNAAELFDRAEALLFAGDAKQAADLFGQASTEAPQSALAPRRQCQTLTELGRHDEAVAACEKAVGNQGSPMDLRAMTAALLSGDAPPTTLEAAHALMHARRARHLMSSEPWGYAAQCDVAARLGDTSMLNDCVADLQRIAPNHYETSRATAIAASIRPGWRTAAGWLAIAGVAIATLMHALLRSRRRGSAATVVGTAVVLAVALSAGRASADGIEKTDNERAPQAGALSKWAIDDKDPSASVPSVAQRDADPLEYGYHLMDLTDKAEAAMRRGDQAAAAKFYAALAKAVPDVSIAYAKMCDAYDAMGDRDKAVQSCTAALGKQGVRIGDYTHYARLVLAKPTRLGQEEIDDLDAVVEHLKNDQAARPAAFEIECSLGVRLGDKRRLDECAPSLAALAPDDTKTLFYQWSLALMQHDYAAASAFLEHAKKSPMPREDVSKMEDATIGALPVWRRAFHDWRIPATLAILVAAALGMAMTWRRSRALA